MTIRMRSAMLVGALAMTAAFVPPALAAAPVTYRMTSEALFEKGCFPPCLCPMLVASECIGTFRLRAVNLTGTVDAYAVEQVDWKAPLPDIAIAGAGTYTTFNEVAALENMELDLVVGDEPVEHFHSNTVPAEEPFPIIALAVSINDMFCHDTVITIQSEPVFGDINGDAVVNINDLLEVIEGWGDCPSKSDPCDADIDPPFLGNGAVDVDDLLLVITSWD